MLRPKRSVRPFIRVPDCSIQRIGTACRCLQEDDGAGRDPGNRSV